MRLKFNPFAVAALFFALVFCLTGLTVFAQAPADSVSINPTFVGFIPVNWKPYIIAAFGIYELIVRYFPTVKNYSIVGFFIKVFQVIVPNKNAATPTQPHP